MGSQVWRRRVLVVLLSGVAAGGGLAAGGDWGQWRGPRRDAVSDETGLMTSWPPGGPPLAWKASGLGSGYSSVVIDQGRLFTLGRRDKDVVVSVLDAATGGAIWQRTIGTTGRIPSSTPTVWGDRLFALDPDGELVCLRAADGELLWQKSFAADFGGKMMSGRGYGESPLVDEGRLICTPGGPDAALAALDPRTGDVLWRTKLPPLGPNGRDGAGFSSAVVTVAAGRRQYVQLMGRGVVGVAAEDGRFLWAYNPIANETANIPTPIVFDDYVFAANGYTTGSVLLKLVPTRQEDGSPGVAAEVVYALTGGQFQNHHGGVVRIGGHLYGGHGNNNGLPTCLELATGRVLWKRRGPGVGSAAVVYADGHLYFRYQNGVVALIRAATDGYDLQGTFDAPGAGGDSWSHPVVAHGRLYLREQDSLWVYDLRAAPGNKPATSPVPPVEGDPRLLALRRLGAAVERLPESSTATTATLPASGEALPGTPRRANRVLLYARRDAVQEEAVQGGSRTVEDAPVPVVVLGNDQLTPEGYLRDELLERLRDMSPPWILSLAGTAVSDQGLAQLDGLSLHGLNLELCGRMTDAGIEPLARLPCLRALVLAGTAVTPAGIRHLAASRSLIALDLEACDGITDAACSPLGSLERLRALVLKKSGFEPHRITNAGLRELGRLAQLEWLVLYGNQITDEGLVPLQRLGNLRELNLNLLPLTDAALQHLRPLAGLERLELLYSEGFAGPRLTDRGISSLSVLGRLTHLDLTGAAITDAGLQQLEPLNCLRRLQLVRTRVTDAGVAVFRMAVPGCEVVR